MKTLLNSSKQLNIQTVIRDRRYIAGALAELGVYQGGNAFCMAKAGAPKKIYLFDTFEGIPEITPDIDVHRIGDFGDTNLKEVKELFRFINAEFRVGKFPDTVHGISDTFSVVHLDADQYETTRLALEYFWARLEVGGIIILDDYRWDNCPGIEKAITEFTARESFFSSWSNSDYQYFIERT